MNIGFNSSKLTLLFLSSAEKISQLSLLNFSLFNGELLIFWHMSGSWVTFR